MRSTSYTLGFAAIVCIVCSLVVSSAATLLKSRQERNIRIDIQKNILRAVGGLKDGEKPTPEKDETREWASSTIVGLPEGYSRYRHIAPTGANLDRGPLLLALICFLLTFGWFAFSAAVL